MDVGTRCLSKTEGVRDVENLDDDLTILLTMK